MGKVKDDLAAGKVVSTRDLPNPYGPKRKQKDPAVIDLREEKEKAFKATEAVTPMTTEKVIIKAAIPGGMVRVMALQDYAGMQDVIYKGDVFLLPERRYKSLAARGWVVEYDGDIPIVDKR